MPAIITHHLIGEEVLERTGHAHALSPDAQAAFLWGCQGPDPLFFAFRTVHASTLHKLAETMHTQKIDEALACFREEANGFAGPTTPTGIAAGDREVAKAYVLGYLCHFIVDSTVHPFVYCTQARAEKELGIRDGSYIHATIESSLDVALLRLMRDTTVAEFDVSAIPSRNDRVTRIAGELYHAVALKVFGQDLPAKAFTQACRDMSFIIKALHAKSGRSPRGLAAVERIVRRTPHSMAEALSHVDEGERCYRYFNVENEPWTNPASSEVSNASYGELVETAVDRFIEVAGAFKEGAPVEEATHGLDFHGDI